jgi:uncharacterized protein (DUF2126 family)
MRYSYNIEGRRDRWLYYWTEDGKPVWTHDRDKALVFNAVDSALEVDKVRKAGEQARRVVQS